MQLTMRPYQSEADYWRIREFLRAVFRLNGGREYSWDVARFDYWRWHVNENIEHLPLEEVIFLWKAPDGEIAAVLNPEGKGEAHLQVHPGHRTAELEGEMIATAEQHLAMHAPQSQESFAPDGSPDLHSTRTLPAERSSRPKTLTIYAHNHDPLRRELLTSRGYTLVAGAEYQRRRPLDLPIPQVPLPPGYAVRSLGEGAELLERCYASGLAFHPDDIEYAVDNRADITWYRNVQTAPLYRRDLDIVAIAPDGAVAAFCTLWFDDVNRIGVFEPVGTVPAHQRRGLGKAVMLEGLRRLKRCGVTMAYVGSYSPRAHALYESVGFTEYDLLEPWEKHW